MFHVGPGSRALLTASFALVVALATGLTAFAYFTSTGTGTGTAGTGTLPAPSITAASPGAGTVMLSWTAAPPPTGSDPVTYYVTRDGGPPAGDCPTAASPSGAVTCTDSGLVAGSYSYTVTAKWRAWTATSTIQPVSLASGAASKLVFTTQPLGGVPEGVPFATSPVVAVQDAAGNLVTSDSGTITLATGSGPAAGVLSCTNGTFPTITAAAGLAAFTGCQMTGTAAAGTYTLKATRTGLTPAISNNVVITVGTASKLVFTTQPLGGVPEGVPFATSPVVAVQDAAGNLVTSDSGTITLATGSGPAAGVLSCTNGTFPTITAAAGLAAFTGCQMTGTAAAGTYTLQATRTGLTPAISGNVVITVGTASKLAFTTQPGSSTGGIAFPVQPQVTVQDVFGNTVTSDASSVTLALGATPGGGSLNCASNPLAASSGLATFSSCAIDRTGLGYTLVATAGSLTPATSSPFDITVGPAAKLTFTTQPSGGPRGTAFVTQPVVTIQDAAGNTVTSDTSPVTLTIGTNPGGGTLSCATNPLGAAAGITAFTGCRIDMAGNGYTLTASSGSLVPATSSPFAVTTPPIAWVATGGTVTRASSGTLSPPIPGGLRVNDLMILIVVNTKKDVTASVTGWTALATVASKAGQDISISLFYRLFQPSDGAPLASVKTDAGGASARIVAYRNVNVTTPLDVAPVTSLSGNGSAGFTPSGLTTASANSYAVSIVAENDHAATAPMLSMFFPQGFRVETGFPDAPPVGNNNNHHAVAVAGRLIPSPVAVTLPTFATNLPGAWAGVSLALRP